MHLRATVIACALLGGSSLTLAAHRSRAPQALEALAPFRGEWEGSGETYATPYSTPGASRVRTSCEWTANRGFLLCDQMIHHDGRTSNDLSIYTYDDSSRAYQFFGVSRGVSRVRTPGLTIAGRTWTYASEFDDRAGAHVRIRTVNDVQDTVITYHTEYTTDGRARWVLMGKGASHRVR